MINKRNSDERQRSMDDMADNYSVRARRARIEQGLPEVLCDPVALNRLADMMVLTNQPANEPAAA